MSEFERLRIGLTGGIGSGKSTVGAVWASLGATLVDLDAIARALSGPGGSAMPVLLREFGSGIALPDGSLDRAAMRARILAEPDAKRRLEAVLHPMIGAEAQSQADAAPGAVVFDVPLLAESAHWRDRCRYVAVVDCDEATQVARVVARSGWPEHQVRQVIAQQSSRAARRAVADAVIHNDDLSLAELQREAAALWRLWMHVGS